MTIDRIAFYSYSQYPSALEQYRVYSPLKQAGIEIIPGIRENQLALEAIDEAPLVLFQRDFSHHFQDYQQVLKRAHAQASLSCWTLMTTSWHCPRITLIASLAFFAIGCRRCSMPY